MFRHAEQSIHEGNWLPILMFGVGHIMFNFAAAQSAPDHVFEYLDVFHILRGAAKIGDEVGAFLEVSPLNSLLDSRENFEVALLSSLGLEDCSQALGQLSLAEYPTGTSEMMRAACEHALEEIEVVDSPRSWGTAELEALHPLAGFSHGGICCSSEEKTGGGFADLCILGYCHVSGTQMMITVLCSSGRFEC
ncbi:hypothetical protein F5Y16DRAFT_394570 [Xylariaceae sp. FL0255]|nr:hypothetical protein F5Y16DRAFT_394570 [Xylariaceae sp. FL0255]